MQSISGNRKLAGLSSKEREILSAFAAAENAVVSADDLIEIHPVPRSAASQILSRLARKGWLRRVKRGLYAPVPLSARNPEPAIEDAWLLADALFAPCFISGWSAAEHWDLTDQIFNSVAVVTLRPQRRSTQVRAGVTFRTQTIRRERFFGTKGVWLGSRRVDVADPHRLVIDILASTDIGGGGRHVVDVIRAYWSSELADVSQLLEYATRYGSGAVFKRLGFLAEKFGVGSEDWLDACRQGISKGISKLDPAGSDKGPVVSRWNLRINLPVEGR